ncbi:VCBS repeat-containing protein [bacterium]|nr:VCBS repeat-containing protein [bacterium]
MKLLIKPKHCILLLFIFAFSEITFSQGIRYNWEQQYYGNLNGEKSLLFSHEMRNSKLAFVDIDGDGDQDIFVGQDNGEIAFFENKGNAKIAEFVLITQQYKAIFEIMKKGRKVKIRNTIDVGTRSSPYLIDIDNDGDFDMFIGSGDGKIWFFRNLGNNLTPVFSLVSSKFENIDVGKNSVPIFADVNLKRKYDLLVGTIEGKVWLYINEGSKKIPNFQKYPPEKVVEFGLETHASPSLFDWDNDGDLDLVVGQKNGTLSLFLNEGDRFYPKWVLSEQNFQLIDIGGESAPCFVDIDNDQDSDMIIGSANPTVFLYENRLQNEKRILWNRSTNLFNFHKLIVTGNRASLAIGDLDNDGDFDLVVGEKSGNLNYYENQGDAKNPNWVLKTEELLFMTGIENSAPTLGDIDGDGDLDLLLGEKQGQIVLILNQGTPKKAEWVLKDKTYFQIDAGSNSVPHLIDIDQDGDLDLLIGNYAGRVILYLNKGNKKDPLYVIESTRFGSAKVSKNAVPAIFDWNQDKYPDMIIGDNEGKLQLLLSPGKVGEDSPAWEADENALFSFDVYSLSHPIMVDYNDDKALDLLIGNDFGDFLLYINKGIEKPDEKKQISADNSIDQQSGSLVVEDIEGKVEVETEPPQGEPQDDEIETPPEITEERSKIKIDPQYIRVGQPLVKNDQISRSVPTLGDLDQDGDLDLIIGSRKGNVYYYENVGTESKWQFKYRTDRFIDTADLRNTSPTLFDLDQDGDLDLIVGSENGRLHFYQNRGSSEQPKFVLEKDFFSKIWISKNTKPSVIDLDGDEQNDIISGNFMGKLVFIKNNASHFEIIKRDYGNIDTKIDSTPFFADLDNSGQLDLVIGSDSGQLFFYRNSSPDLKGNWELIPKYAKGLTFPRGTSPIVYDIDKDGDLDLITGSEMGEVILYRNDAIVLEKEEGIEQDQQPVSE